MNNSVCKTRGETVARIGMMFFLNVKICAVIAFVVNNKN